MNVFIGDGGSGSGGSGAAKYMLLDEGQYLVIFSLVLDGDVMMGGVPVNYSCVHGSITQNISPVVFINYTLEVVGKVILFFSMLSVAIILISFLSLKIPFLMDSCLIVLLKTK